MFVLRAFLCPKQKIVIISGTPNCDLVAWCLHFGALGGYFGSLGAPWATLGAAGRTRGVQGLISNDFGMILEPHFDSFSGTEG